MCECSNLGSIFYGKKAEDITELVSVIYEINTNYKTWETEYVCKVLTFNVDIKTPLRCYN